MDHDSGTAEGRPQLDYPCEWGYRVIAGQESHIRLAIRQAFGEHPVRVGELRRSSGGRWCSISVDTTVESDEQRHGFFARLKQSAGIRLVL
jgi:putative lipoic acid-binding regulatory protein